jgi:thioredoxin:protein disulfide reductase
MRNQKGQLTLAFFIETTEPETVKPARAQVKKGTKIGDHGHLLMKIFGVVRNSLVAAVGLLVGGLIGVSAFAADDFLPPELAFKSTARALNERAIEVEFKIAPGYYLYREQFKFEANGATFAAVLIPPGKVKFDETFQRQVETHRDLIRIAIPVTQATARFKLAVTYQGCADRGLCYPPAQLNAEVSLTGFGGYGSVEVAPGREMSLQSEVNGQSVTAPSTPATGSNTTAGINTVSAIEGSRIAEALKSGRYWTVAGVFFLAGVLLSLTPCVLPMLPILSALIVGQGAAVSRWRGLLLAASYSLGMAAVYSGLGVAAGLAGEGLAAALQNGWVLGAFAVGLVALSLSMFGVYELQLPASLTGRLAAVSNRLPAGRLLGVFLMGGVSALIVSPCVAAPLAGALVYLSQTRDVALGGSALFALACGMSVPLLLLGASAGAWLPKAGAWMNDVKRFFGILLLAVAVWTIQPVAPAWASMALWGALALTVAALLWRRQSANARVVRQAAAIALTCFGLLQWAASVAGGADPLRPWAQWTGRSTPTALTFKPVRNVAELDAALLTAGRPVMLDFYADWCVSCKEMEAFTFSDPLIQARLRGALLLKVDVTQNNAADRALLKRFGLFGPPGTLFFDAQGSEVSVARVLGYQNSTRFVQTLRAAGL